MIELYLIRHGETEWNKESICQGRTDFPLNLKGKEEASEVAKELKAKNYKFDLYISSPLKRAFETTEIIKNELTNNKNDILIDNYFIERNFGYFEGKKNILFTDAYKNKKLGEYYKSGLESESVLISRVVKGINELIKTYDNKKILIVTHSNIIRALLVFINADEYNFLTKIPNLSISYFTVYKENDFKLNKLYLFNNKYEDKTIS